MWRTKPTPGSQLALLVDYAYHAFVTDRTGDKVFLDSDHRRHAVVENAIRYLKYGVGLNHLPSAPFGANSAWLGLNVIAHNMASWTARLGGVATVAARYTNPADVDIATTTTAPATSTDIPERKSFVATDTLRRRHLAIPGRLTTSASRLTVHLPTHWP